MSADINLKQNIKASLRAQTHHHSKGNANQSLVMFPLFIPKWGWERMGAALCLRWWMLSWLSPSRSWNVAPSGVVSASWVPGVPLCKATKISAEIPAPRLGVCITSRGLVNAFAVPHPHPWNWITAGLLKLLWRWLEISEKHVFSWYMCCRLKPLLRGKQLFFKPLNSYMSVMPFKGEDTGDKLIHLRRGPGVQSFPQSIWVSESELAAGSPPLQSDSPSPPEVCSVGVKGWPALELRSFCGFLLFPGVDLIAHCQQVDAQRWKPPHLGNRLSRSCVFHLLWRCHFPTVSFSLQICCENASSTDSGLIEFVSTPTSGKMEKFTCVNYT